MKIVNADKIMEYLENYCHYSDNPDYDNGHGNGINVAWERLLEAPSIDPVHAANACYCKECLYYEPLRDYPDCSKKLPYGYCCCWKYEEGESPNEVDENDFCSKGVPKNV